MIRLLKTYLLWSGYSLGSFLVCIWLAWQLAAQVNFLYPAWYSMLSIDQTVEQTVPKHLYKKQFALTDTTEHQRLFAEIVTSIQQGGKGLAEITFKSPDGQVLDRLLTASEVTHLQDVANLIDLLTWFALIVFILCLMNLALIIFFRVPMPSAKKLFVSLVAIVIIFLVGILLYGAKEFFYWLHTVIFPSEHQWFFYYEESLMSTLMKAPDLFAPIAVMLLITSLFVWWLHLVIIEKFAGFKTL